MAELTQREQNIVDRIEELIYKGEISQHCQVQIIELIGKYLGIETIQDKANTTGKSYNGIKKTYRTIDLFGCKFCLE